MWVLSDLAITGDPLWSLTNTRHTAETLDRVTGIANVPEYIPRRIGEILRPPVLAGAALGGVLSLLWLRRRALLGAVAGVLAVVVFAAFATVGLPINTRYAFLAAAILCIFCGAGVFGWMCLRARRSAAALVDGGRARWWWSRCSPTLPSQYRSAHRELDKLARQHSIEDDLLALVRQPRDQPALRARRRAQPRARPAAGAVPEDEPRATSSARRAATSPPACTSTRPARKSKKTTCSTPTTRASAVSVPPGFTESPPTARG